MDEVWASQLRKVIPVLREQRDIVVSRGNSFAGHLIDLAIVQLRLRLHDISDQESFEFSDFLGGDLVSGECLDRSGGATDA